MAFFASRFRSHSGCRSLTASVNKPSNFSCLATFQNASRRRKELQLPSCRSSRPGFLLRVAINSGIRFALLGASKVSSSVAVPSMCRKTPVFIGWITLVFGYLAWSLKVNRLPSFALRSRVGKHQAIADRAAAGKVAGAGGSASITPRSQTSFSAVAGRTSSTSTTACQSRQSWPTCLGFTSSSNVT